MEKDTGKRQNLDGVLVGKRKGSSEYSGIGRDFHLAQNRPYKKENMATLREVEVERLGRQGM